MSLLAIGSCVFIATRSKLISQVHTDNVINAYLGCGRCLLSGIYVEVLFSQIEKLYVPVLISSTGGATIRSVIVECF